MAQSIGPKFADPPVYQLKVSLIGSRPLIWRRFQALGSVSLFKLHLILQIVMGWENYHLHWFTVGRTHFAEQDLDTLDVDPHTNDEHTYTLQQIAPTAGSKLLYEYDSGDNWQHDITVEKILSADSGKHYPRCLEGARACPPEDCGGIPGYNHLLRVLSDQNHLEYDELREWAGNFHPDTFSVTKVNSLLACLTPPLHA